MMRKDWPFHPYIHQKIWYTDGKPDRLAATVILFVKTPTGRWSKTKMFYVTCYEDIIDGRTNIGQTALYNKAIAATLATAPRLQNGYQYSGPCLY